MPTLSVGRASNGGRGSGVRGQGMEALARLSCNTAPPLRKGVWASAPVPRPLAPENGVTLMELLVVMAIVGLIVAVSAPSVGAGIDSVRLASTSDSISSFLNSAVNHAERRQQP